MIKALSLSEVVDYTLKDDRENPTIFKLGVIPSDILIAIGAKASQGVDVQAEMMFVLLQVGIKGWENFSKPFATTEISIPGLLRKVIGITREAVSELPATAVTELSGKIMEINKLGVAEQKN